MEDELDPWCHVGEALVKLTEGGVYNRNFMSAKDLSGIRKKKTCSWARARMLKENSFHHPQRCFAISQDPNTMEDGALY